jgi:hypothetical protein
MACREVISFDPETLVQLDIVGIEQGIDIHALHIGSRCEEKIEKIPTSRLQSQIKRRVPLKLKAIPPAQQEKGE